MNVGELGEEEDDMDDAQLTQLPYTPFYADFLKAQWVAPLGSIALIFNFIFAKILVGTQITRKDVLGTILVMASVVWIVVFGGINSGGDIEESLTIMELKALFSRVVFIIYFSVLNIVVFALLTLGLYAYWAISLDDESGELRKKMKSKLTRLLGTNWFSRLFSGLTLQEEEELDEEAGDLRLRKIVAMIMATSGGLLASQTLLLAKSGIKLVTSTFAGQSQFQDMLSFFIIFILVFTAILQVYCLNTALKLYDSVLVVPMFYGYYTAFGLINSIIYLNQIQSYQPWVLFLILLGIGILILGVRMLSAPKPELDLAIGSVMDEASGDNGDYHHDDEEGGGVKAHESHSRNDKATPLEKFKNNNDDDTEIRRSSPLQERMDEFRNQGSDSETKKMAGSIAPVNLAHILLEGEQDPKTMQPLGRRSSLPHTVLKAFGIHERRLSVDRGRSSLADERKRGASLPKIDTGIVTRGRSETRRGPASARLASVTAGPRPMSPSEFRAQYTNSPFPIKPKHLQDGAPGLGRSGPSSPALEDDTGRGLSPRWATSNTKIGHVFEDLNPFKILRRNSIDSSAFMPVSPGQSHQSRQHVRRDSSTGLPSEWDEVNRRSKHSMLFGERGRSGSVGSKNSSRSSSPAPSQYMHSPSHSRRHSTHDGNLTAPNGVWATNAAMGASGGTGPYTATLSGIEPHPFASSTGTFGTSSSEDLTSASGQGPLSALPPSVQQQLQQLQQHQHRPTSQLQHSITTSSISTIGSVMPSMSTSTSLAQIADNSYGKHGPSFPQSTSSTSLWMNLTPSQTMQAIELDMDDLDRGFHESTTTTN
ncbi:hypothetical protein BGZ98_009234 [Dissophora globulifera]|nr:hypothetical protein BGZ98_009234 [Dissophora globulifera]